MKGEDVRGAIVQAMRVLAELDLAAEWAGWLLFALEYCEERARKRGVHKLDIEAMLGLVRDSLDVRLKTGRW